MEHTQHLTPNTGGELKQVQDSMDINEKIDEERLSQSPYQHLQTAVHELESSKLYKKAMWKGMRIIFSPYYEG